MSVSGLFKATESNSPYHDVCDIKQKNNKDNSNVLKSLSGLKCEGNELHEWTSQKKEYFKKFMRARHCLERRLTTMKRFSAHSEKNKTSRRKHVYPIQVAYTYGKDCLKKFATKKQQEAFTKSVNSLVDNVSKSQGNVREYFGNSIENSIRTRNDIPDIKELLNRQYYNSNQTELINKARKVGNNEAKLSPNNRERYLSLFNEGFSRGNAAAARAAALEEAYESDSSSDSENETPSAAASAAPKPRRRKRKSKLLKNMKNFEMIANNNNSSISTDPNYAAIESEINKRIDALEKLFAEKMLIDKKLYYIEDIYYSAFSTINRVNKNVVEKEKSILKLSIKTAKKLAFNDKYRMGTAAMKQRAETKQAIEHVHKILMTRLERISDEIDSLLTSDNRTIDSVVENYYMFKLPRTLLQKTDKKIDTLSNNDFEKYEAEFDELSQIRQTFEEINNELLALEVKLDTNLLRQKKSQEMIDNVIFKNRKNIIESAKKKLEELKSEQTELDKQLLKLYKKKTDKIHDVLQQVSIKYQNPFVLVSALETLIMRGIEKMLLGL